MVTGPTLAGSFLPLHNLSVLVWPSLIAVHVCAYLWRTPRLIALRIIELGHALKKTLRLVAKQRGETVADVGHEAGAENVCGPSLKAVLDRDWDQVEL